MIFFRIKLRSNQTINSKFWIIFLCINLITSCASVKNLAVESDITRLLNRSEIFSNHFTGFSLLDIETNQIVAGHNATLKFTPASNTKLLTMYTSLKSFQDSIPSLLIERIDSGVLVEPLGDPTFLYQPFKDQKAFNALGKNSTVHISWPEENLEPFGTGWAWDDYIYSYQTQRSWWPIYGNVINIKKSNDSLTIAPQFFEDYVEVLKQSKPGELVDRDPKFNIFKVYLESDTSNFERSIPFEYSKNLFLQILRDTLQTNVEFVAQGLTNPDTLYSEHIDSVISHMLKPSDNFLAEQLLIVAARKSGFDDIKQFMNQVRSTWLASLTDIVWVDGSGLSRYNLISPIDQVRLLKICHDEFGWKRITSLLPSGGEGTLEDRFVAEEPYIFAKTGTLSNNHNLSGFLVTKSGKRMIFSFMNNHYTRPTQEIKEALDSFLMEVRNAY